MEILIALGVAIAIAARKFMRNNQAEVNDAWSAAAAHLDLDYSRAAVFKPRRIQGRLQGNGVEVSTVTRHTGKSRRVSTRYRVSYPRPLRLGLKITETKLLSGISVFLGAQDIETGDVSFDSRFIVKGNNLYRVADFLNAFRREAVTDLFDELEGVTLDDEKIEYISGGIVGESTELIDTLIRLSWAATRICEGDQQQAETGPVPDAIVEEAVTDTVITEAPEAARPKEEPHLPQVANDVTVDVPFGPDADTVCEDLFPPSVMSFEARKLFEERYKDRSVRWTGNLRRVSSYRIDLNFGGGPGTKATFDLNLDGGGTAGRTIQAIVQLPPEADAALRSRVGDAITFEGTLAACDALVRNFHIADGQIV